jgi:hypothetical protein
VELWCVDGWPTYSGGDAESLTARRALVQRCRAQPDLPTVGLHVGEHDPDGTDLQGAQR